MTDYDTLCFWVEQGTVPPLSAEAYLHAENGLLIASQLGGLACWVGECGAWLPLHTRGGHRVAQFASEAAASPPGRDKVAELVALNAQAPLHYRYVAVFAATTPLHPALSTPR